MAFDIAMPTEVELADLLAKNAHRAPEKARVVVVDGDTDVRLPLLLGIPSGACAAPDPLASAAWDNTVAATFKMRADVEEDTEALVEDCVLWPPPAVWATWTARWPALPQMVLIALRQKLGASMKQIYEPARGEKPLDSKRALLEPIAKLVAAHPGATWRRLTFQGVTLVVAMRPPDSGVYRLFKDAMSKRGAKAAALARDFAAACTLGIVFDGGAAISAEEVFARWPGAYLLLAFNGVGLAGLAAEVELGNW
jgi:hypothetical protein